MEAIFLFLVSLCISEIGATEQNEIECPPLPLVEFPNGKIQVLSANRILFSCHKDFILFGPNFLFCENGNWSSSIIPSCRRPINTCQPPEPLIHGSILGNSWNFGDEIIYICHDGYRLLGSEKRKCLRSKHWDGIEPICQDENEPLASLADRMKNQFISKVGDYSSDSTARAIGIEIRKIGLEMVFLIDRSSSVDPVDFKRGIEFAKFLVEEFGARNGINSGVGTRIAIITFGDTAEIVVNINDENVKNKHDAMNILDSLQPEGGGTAMASALNIIPSNIATLLRQKAKRVIFLLTDGQNNIGITPPRKIATLMKEELEFEIFAVGIGQDINKEELVEIASSPQKNHVFLLNSYSELNEILWYIRNKDATEVPPTKSPVCGFIPETQKPRMLQNWPWLAAIYVVFPSPSIPKIGICSGSLICPRWVLTSANCFYGEDKNNLMRSTKNVFVTLGERNLALHEKTERNFYAVNVRIHPNFDRTKGGENDLALLKLNEEASLEDNYRILCLPGFDLLFNENKRVNLAGWGTIPSEKFFRKHFVSSFGMFPVEINLPITRDFECDRVNIRITDNLFCAGSIVNRTCIGNLGSPLVMKDKENLHYLIGVLTEKEQCNTEFNVFIRVEKHLSWINNVTESCQKKMS